VKEGLKLIRLNGEEIRKATKGNEELWNAKKKKKKKKIERGREAQFWSQEVRRSIRIGFSAHLISYPDMVDVETENQRAAIFTFLADKSRDAQVFPNQTSSPNHG